MAKPHGFSAATNPAPKAKPIRSWSTRARRSRRSAPLPDRTAPAGALPRSGCSRTSTSRRHDRTRTPAATERCIAPRSTPSASLRFVKLRLYFDTKLFVAATSERAATPTKVTFGLAAATWLTLGASALQNGHHGVQNHNTAGLPTRLEPLNGAPDTVVPVNCRRSSATAEGGLTRVNAKAAATKPSRKDLIVRKNRVSIPHLLPFKLHRVSGRGLTLLNTLLRPPGFTSRKR